MNKKIVNIIIPCYNEEKNIKILYKELEKTLIENNNITFNYVCINDGSTDKTLEKLKEIKKIHTINFSRNFGKESAILAGLDYSDFADAAIVIDADLQMPVNIINELVQKWNEGYKLVLTTRKSRKKGFKQYLAKKYYTIYNNITNLKIEQNALDYQLMDKNVIKIITSYREYNRFFKGISGEIGFKRYVIDVEMIDRVHGDSSFNSIGILFSYAMKSIFIHSKKPLLISIYFGFFASITGFIYSIYIILDTLINGNKVPGYSSIISFLLIFFGIVLLVLGIIGYYVGLIYDETKNRPRYIIDEKE